MADMELDEALVSAAGKVDAAMAVLDLAADQAQEIIPEKWLDTLEQGRMEAYQALRFVRTVLENARKEA